MNVAGALVLVVAALASTVVYLLMRHPGMRRVQYRDRRAFSVGVSLACALALFVVLAALTWMLQTP